MSKRGVQISLWRLSLILTAPTLIVAFAVHFFLQREQALGHAYILVVLAIGAGVGWLEALLASAVVRTERALSVEPVGPLGTEDPRDLEFLVVFIALVFAALLAAGYALSLKRGESPLLYDPHNVEFLVVFMVVAFTVSLVSAMRRRQLERTNKRLEDEIIERTKLEQKLQAQRDRLHSQARLLDLANDAILAFDAKDGSIRYWNEGAEKLYGWSKPDAVGKDAHTLLKTVFPRPLSEVERAVLEQGTWEGELVHTKRDGMQVPVASRWTLQHSDNGHAATVLEINRDITEKKLAAQQLEKAYAELEVRVKQRTAELAKANEQLHKHIAYKEQVERKLRESERYLSELSAQLISAEDEERRRIGRDLHDSVGQYLAALMINLDLLRANVPPSDRVAARCAECLKIADSCVTEVRTISYLMYPPLLDEMGLRQAIPWYVSGFEQRSGIKATVEIPENLGRLRRDLEAAIFRILQESLTNIQIHSKATEASVRLMTGGGQVIFEVKDNGRGFPQGALDAAESALATASVGLRGMKERALHLGGELVVRSDAQGTTITATLPDKKPTQAAARP